MAKKPVRKFTRPDANEKKPLKAAPIRKKSEKAGKAGKPKAEPKEKPPAPAKGGGRVAFICSECYEDFDFNGDNMQETITCPECLHIGKKPDPDFLETVKRHKGGERSALVAAVVVLILFLIAALGAIHVSSAPHILQSGDSETLTMAFVGGSVLLALTGIFLVVRYEKNRWEIYF